MRRHFSSARTGSTGPPGLARVSAGGHDDPVGRGVIVGQEFGADFSDAWYRTPKYEALTAGAIFDAGVQDIDLLVLGLPVSHYLQSKPAEYLKDKYRNSSISVGGKTFSIGEVSALPQTLGSYLLLGEFVSKINTEFRRVGRDPIKDVSHLVGMPIMVMNPGQETMDWIVYQDGVVIQDASGAEGGHGRMHIIQHVAERMERDTGMTIKWGSRVDMNMALLQKKPIFVTGKRIDTADYVGVAKAAAGDSVDLVLTRVGNMLDRIQMIVVAGGHPEYYVEYLRSKLPNVPVIDSGLGIFGNVTGFLLSGEETMRRTQQGA